MYAFFQDGGCGFFAWHDGELGQRANTVINELLNDVDKLYEENKKLRRGNDHSSIYEELVAIHGEVRKLKGRHEVREREIIRGEMKLRLAIGTLIISWVLLVVLYVCIKL